MPFELVLWTDEQIAQASPHELALYQKYQQKAIWRDDPARWARERLGIHLWSKQVQVIESIRDNRHTASPAGFDLGKSYTGMVAVCWWIDTAWPGEKVLVITTAPGGEQVDGIIWREINIMHEAKKLPGRVSTREWKVRGTLVGRGTKPSDYSTAAFQGYHADRVLVILDEAAGVKEQFWEGADGIAANDDSRVLAIGNPESINSKFGQVCQPGTKWNVIPITAFDSPNITGEEVPENVRRNLVGLTWIEEKREEWGEDSPQWLSKVLAKFVRDTSSTVVPYSWAIRNTHREGPFDATLLPIELGVDVGAGGDESVIQSRYGWTAGPKWKSQHDDPMQLVGEIVRAQRETGATAIKIDGIGVGWAIVGRVREVFEQWTEPDENGIEQPAPIDCEVIGVDVRNQAVDTKTYANLRSEIWWEVGRELCRTNAWDLTDVDDQTINELCEPKYKNDSTGRIRVEPKEETIKRLGRSPDNADGLLLAFYVPAETGFEYIGSD